MILAAVFLLSASSLAFEVLLTRIFSISQWNHLSFMVISIALFGFAASGTFLGILDARKQGWEKLLSTDHSHQILSLLYSLTAILSYIVLNRMPLDFFRLELEPVQALYLLAAYLILCLPFFLAGLIVSLAYVLIPDKTGRTYLATMTGSAVGAFAPFVLVPFCGEGPLIILVSLIPLVILPFPGRGVKPLMPDYRRSGKPYFIMLLAGIGWALTAVFFIFHDNGAMIHVRPSAYKFLSQMLKYPNTRIAETAFSLKGRIDRVESPYVRFAPGLSLKYTEKLPDQWVAFKDADDPFVFFDSGQVRKTRFGAGTLSFAGYHLIPDAERTLIIQSGGGSAIACAIASGVRNIQVVENNPHIAELIRRHYGLAVIDGNSKTFLKHTDERFDVIQIENWGPSIPGAAALTQNHLFTVASLKSCLEHLSSRGVLIISRKLLLPPADSLRLWSSAYESLKMMNSVNPGQHIAMLRNWDTFTLIVSLPPLGPRAEKLKDFARQWNFDLVYLPVLSEASANRYSMFDRPFHFLEISRLARAYETGNQKRHFSEYFLDVKPQTDDRPFPSRFLKWSGFQESYQASGSRFYPLFMSGEIVAWVVFIEALIVSVVLLLMPLLAIRARGRRFPVRSSIFFLSVGAGFMFVEMFFIKVYTLLFADPVISFTMVITGVLVFSGVGGYLSGRIDMPRLRYGLAGLIACLVIGYFSVYAVVDRLFALSLTAQYVWAFALLLPAGLLMGLPFPVAMQRGLESPFQRAHAWAANGCASVLASILSVQVALNFGISTIMLAAVCSYLISLFSARGPVKAVVRKNE